MNVSNDALQKAPKACSLRKSASARDVCVIADHGCCLQESGWVSYRYSDMLDMQRFDDVFDAMQVQDHASPLVSVHFIAIYGLAFVQMGPPFLAIIRMLYTLFM